MKAYRIVLLFMSVVLFWSLGCAKDLVTGKQTMNWYSIESDIKLGSNVMNRQVAALRKKGERKGVEKVDSKKNRDQLILARQVVTRIKPVTHYPDFPYEVHVADVDIANAWCAPGGKIMIFEGLWDPKKGLIERGDADELAAVLSHEIAHATARHVTEMLSRGMAIQLIGTAAMAGIHAGAGAQAAGAFGQATSLGLNIYFPLYTRESETEADKIGIVYMAKAGYDPRVAVRLWERAAKKKGDKFSVFATHPSSGERAKTLREMLPEAMQYYEVAKKKYEKPRKKKYRKRRKKTS
jgi:predicted Zn-dependent protease